MFSLNLVLKTQSKICINHAFYSNFNNRVAPLLFQKSKRVELLMEVPQEGGSFGASSYFMNPGRTSREERDGLTYTDSHLSLIKDGITRLLLVIIALAFLNVNLINFSLN